MAKGIAVDKRKVFQARAKGDTTTMCTVLCMVGPRRIGDLDRLLRKGIVLVVSTSDKEFHLVEPAGSIHALPKACMEVIGPAERGTIIEASKDGFAVRRV